MGWWPTLLATPVCPHNFSGIGLILSSLTLLGDTLSSSPLVRAGIQKTLINQLYVSKPSQDILVDKIKKSVPTGRYFFFLVNQFGRSLIHLRMLIHILTQ